MQIIEDDEQHCSSAINPLTSLNEEDELYLQNLYSLTNPTIVIESKNNEKFDQEDMKNMLKKFGNIKFIEFTENLIVVQFEKFFSVHCFYQFYNNCLKENSSDKENKSFPFIIRFFESKDEEEILKGMDKKMNKISDAKIVENVNEVMINYFHKKHGKNSFGSIYNLDDDEEALEENLKTNILAQYNYYNIISLSKKGQQEFNKLIEENIKRGDQNLEIALSANSNQVCPPERSISKGKFVCKFFLQIEGDKKFGAVRRIIGARGTNLKRIMDYCSRGPNGVYIPDAIMLRLRGRGAGNRYEKNDEPLNLCVISKYQDKYKKACSFVVELIINVYEEYKRYCERKGKTPNNNLIIEKKEYVSTTNFR